MFILVNLVLFQPFAWDNTKLLAWAAVGFAALAAYAITQIWRIGQAKSLPIKIAVRFFAVLLFIIMTFSGAIDAYRILKIPSHSYVMYNANELQLAQWVTQNTPVDSIWLTSDQHNHWLYNLTGRQTMMAYRGWLWTYGYNYLPTEKVVRTMFAGGEIGKKLLNQYHVKYIVVGTSERRDFLANENFFDRNFPVIYTLGGTKIYKVY